MNDKEFAKVKICYIQNGIPPRYFDEKCLYFFSILNLFDQNYRINLFIN